MLVDGWTAGRSGGLRAPLVVVLASLALGTGVAAAACGGVSQEHPHKDVSFGRAPLAIGDSSMLFALGPLADEGYLANARGCRQWAEGLALIRDRRRADHLPRLVVVALGADGVITKGDIHEAMRLVGKRRTLGLVTPLELGGSAGHDAKLVRSEAEKHANRITLLDWVNYSQGHPGWFAPDGLHLTFEGADGMARLLKRPLKQLPPPH